MSKPAHRQSIPTLGLCLILSGSIASPMAAQADAGRSLEACSVSLTRSIRGHIRHEVVTKDATAASLIRRLQEALQLLSIARQPAESSSGSIQALVSGPTPCPNLLWSFSEGHAKDLRRPERYRETSGLAAELGRILDEHGTEIRVEIQPEELLSGDCGLQLTWLIHSGRENPSAVFTDINLMSRIRAHLTAAVPDDEITPDTFGPFGGITLKSEAPCKESSWIRSEEGGLIAAYADDGWRTFRVAPQLHTFLTSLMPLN